jgi:predicted PurR-regulated permease PerM
MEDHYLDISWKAILKVAFTAALCYLLFLIHDILIWFLFALIISILLRSLIDFFYHRKVPYWLSVLLTYVVIFGSLGGMIYLIMPVMIGEVRQAIVALPVYLAQLQGPLQRAGIEIPFASLQQLSSYFLQQTPQGITQFLGHLFGGLASAAFVLTMAVFLSFEKKGFGEMIAFLSSHRYQDRILRAWKSSRREVSHWFGMRIIGSLFIALTYFLTYQLFGIKAALVLALVAGILDFIPYFGPLVAIALGGLLTGFQFSWPLAAVVAMILFVFQAIEGHLLTPLVGKKLIGLPPYLILLAITVGGLLFNFMGSLLGIPVAAIIYRFVIDFKTGAYQGESSESRRVEIE